MTSGSESPHLALIVKTVPVLDMEWCRTQIDGFAAHYPGARVVSFVDDLALETVRHAAIENWRSVVDYDRFFKMWYAAYARTDELFDGLDEWSWNLFAPFYHISADQYLRAALLHHLMASEVGPFVLILPPELAPCRPIGRFQVRREAGLRLPGLPAYVRPHHFARLGARLAGLPLRYIASGLAPRKKDDGAQIEPRANEDEKQLVLIAVEDGPSGVNRIPALKIAAELKERPGCQPVLVTTNPRIAEDAGQAGLEAVNVSALARLPSPARLWRDYRRLAKSLRAAAENVKPPGHQLVNCVLRRLTPQIVLYQHGVSASLDRIAARSRVRNVLVVNESSSLCVAAILWAKRRGLKTLGYWPALLGDRPDCRFFPADRHLVYGDQIANQMIGSGVPPDRVRSVGSVTFDNALGRDAEADRKLVRKRILPLWQEGMKLVIVGTEALPRPLEEIEPALQALLQLAQVYVAIKVHPADSIEFYQEVARRHGSRQRIEVVGKCDLDALLNSADLLICVLSNIIVTAAQLGTPTLVCDFADKRRPLDFVKAGLCLGCFDRQELAEMVRALLSDSPQRKTALEMMGAGLRAFNGPNDGLSHIRVAQEVLDGDDVGTPDPD